MYPAYLLRTGIDWVRNNEAYKESNPYSRCLEAVNACLEIWREQRGLGNLDLVEPAAVAAYWAEIFHVTDPHPDEMEWRDGLLKRSAQYDSFEQWQEWFKESYAQVYKDDIYWMGVLTTSWAHTHQLEVGYAPDSWEFKPATPYLQTDEFWRFEPHMDTVAEILREVWAQEKVLFEESGFSIEEQSIPYLGKPECLDFDTRRYVAIYPARAERDKETIELGELVADLVLPAGDSWYRTMDSVIFAHEYLDATALITRARYLIQSRRRFMELLTDTDPERARRQAAAEGWLVGAAG
ncbi:MAG: hypothetical protein K2W82_06515 [Candidatus Obscuribacterales bacterium]|nr:hypothetical protein [Candidatus Obscuribacterales bacterium]